MSTTAEKTADSDVVTTVIRCPSWCGARTNHGDLAHEQYVTTDGQRVLAHIGPSDFGPFWVNQVCDAETGKAIGVTAGAGDIDDKDFDAAGLRELAAEAIAAAQWLEARA